MSGMAHGEGFRERMRVAALDAAVASLGGAEPSAILTLASQFEAWLTGRTITVTIGVRTYLQGGGPSVPTKFSGKVPIVKDTQQIVATVSAEDAKGFVVPDALTWSEDSAGAVITLQPSDDGSSCTIVAVAPGSAVVTATDGAISGTASIDVTAGDVASIAISLGDPVDQPTA